MSDTQILTVVTGSRLHGLNSPQSDTDLRGVFMNDLADIVNPFEKPKDTRWIEGATADDTSYELRKFVKEAVAGNPNFIEILFSDRYIPEATTEMGLEMQRNAERFIDSKRIFEAFKGYAGNQYNKMNLFDPDVRTPKFAVAYIRSLLNGVELLRYGTITNPVPETFTLLDGEEITPRADLLQIKFTPWQEFSRVAQPIATRLFSRLQVELANVFYSQAPREADREWITGFVREAYGL